MNFNQNRLRFVHCEHLFSNFTEITEYVRSVQYERASLYAEPMIFKYGDEKNPNIVLAIGSVGEGKFAYDTENGEVLNKTFYIDFSQAERDIEQLYKEVGENREEIERVDGIVKNMISSCGFDEEGNYVSELDDHIIGDATSLFVADKMLSDYIIALEKKHELYVKETHSVKLTTEKGDSGVTLSSDVKLGTKIYNGRVIDNIIIEQEDGIFTNVDLNYSKDENKLTFVVNGENSKDIILPTEVHIIKGEYDPYNENLVLTLNAETDINGEKSNKVEINMSKLIDEWNVLGENSNTPIVLTKEHVKSVDSEHEGIYDYQDILKADVRILDKTKSPDNILSKDSSGKYLYVEGTASNISYIRNNEKTTVQVGLDEKLSKTDISQRDENTINLKNDGLYSFVDVSYDSALNKLIFKRTNPSGNILQSEYTLNSVQLIQKAYFDVTTEEIVISYIDATGTYQELRIPLQIIVNELDVDNTDSTVTLVINRNPQGQDTIKANVNIAKMNDNILSNIGHELYVKGTADNIKMIDVTLGTNVEAAISALDNKATLLVNTEASDRAKAVENVISSLNSEISRAKESEALLKDNIEAEELRATLAEESITRSLNDEISRAKNAEAVITNELNKESERALSSENALSEALNAEIKRSSDEDTAMTKKWVEETERAKAAEHTLSVDLINENERATLKENELERLINGEIERSKNQDDSLKSIINNEITRATSVEDTIKNDLIGEVKRATASENSLNDAIVGEKDRATWAEHEIQDNLLAEQKRAEAAEKVLSDNLAIENQRALKAEGELSDKLNNETIRAKAAETSLGERIDAEVSRSQSKDEELNNKIDKARVDLSYVVKNSGTINLTKNTEDFGTSIVGNVNVSPVVGNIINGDGQALFANVDLSYDSASNTLILKRSGNIDKTIQLNEGSLIDSIVYDDITKDLIITYRDSYGNERQERVNVTDLFNQWVVESNHMGAVQLTKETNYNGKGTDKLTAEVVVSTLNTNLLKNDQGSLYVSNSANGIMLSNGFSVGYTINSMLEKDRTLTSDLEKEVSRATSKESDLERLINEEVSRAKASEESLSNGLENALNNTSDAVSDLITSLSIEVDRAKASEQSLNDAINAETERAEKAERDLSDLISKEEARAKSEELNISNELKGEISRAIANENSLKESITNEINRATAKDLELETAINGEIARAKNIEQILTDSINSEVVRAEKAEQSLSTMISDETTRATYAETTLSTNIENETNRAKSVETSLLEKVNAEIERSINKDSELEKTLSSEIVRAKDAEQVLTDSINSETTRAEKAEHLLEDSIVNVTNEGVKTSEALVKEIERATNMEDAINSKIDGEIARATEAEKANYNDIVNEINRAMQSERNIEISLADEVSRAREAESKLQGNIEIEATRATSRENELYTLINNNTLNLSKEQERATTSEATLRNDIDTEVARAIASDDALKTSITNEIERATKEESRIESLVLNEIGRAQIEEAKISKDIETLASFNSDNAENISTTLAKVNEIEVKYATSVKNTSTVDLLKESNENGGIVLSADVKLSQTEGNQIIKYSDGIFSNVSLTYSNNNNTLHFTSNGNTIDIPLTSVSTIEKITYDAENNEIVISYISNGELKETRFSASSLFKPVVSNNDGNNVIVGVSTNEEGASELSANLLFKDNVSNASSTVTLSATDDNKLVANVNIGGISSARNILEVSEDGNSLYVNGQAVNIDMVNTQLGSGTEKDPHVQVTNVEQAIHTIDDRVDVLRREFEAYVDEDLINSISKDVNNLKFKTNISTVDSPSIDLSYTSTENSSTIKADVVVSQDPHNLLKVHNDGLVHEGNGNGVFVDGSYNGVLFDGNIDYLTFSHSDVPSGSTDHFADFTRHLQLKRENIIFRTKQFAIDYMTKPSFLEDKKDGEPLLARYYHGSDIACLLAFVKVENGNKTLQFINSVGTLITNVEYFPNQSQVVTTDEFGVKNTVNINPESLYIQYTDGSNRINSVVVPMKGVIEEFVYPQAKATFDGKVVTDAYGVNNTKEIFDENDNPIYVETETRRYNNVNFDIERVEDGHSYVRADVDYFDCGDYDNDGEDYITDDMKYTTFKINGKTYNGEDGMTWKDWINSEYNTNGSFIDGDRVWYDSKYYIHGVTPNNFVVNGMEYSVAYVDNQGNVVYIG